VTDSSLPALSSADVATAGGERIGVILGLPPAWPHASVVAPAFTLSSAAGDNLALHHAIVEAPFGSVLVVRLTGATAAGHWGELMSIAAAAAGIRGLVVTGTVRDIVKIEALGFPVFHSGVSPRPATKSDRGELGIPVEIGGVRVRTGDLIVADTDGIAVIPRARIDAVIADVIRLERREAEIVQLLQDGASTLEVLGLEQRRTQ
jgi:4-hydroxy-4-methyl-2-oxoglutarate aldolase